MNNSKDVLEFPWKGAEACPICGETDTLGKAVIEQLKGEGKLPRTSAARGLAVAIPFTEALAAPVMIKPEIPVLGIQFDICSKCKILYCIEARMGSQPVDIRRSPR